MSKQQFSMVKLPIGDLIENPKNPRVHPEEQIKQLKASLKRFGQPRPVLARQANKMLIAGHGLVQAMKAAGHKDVEAILWDVGQKEADAFMIADNRLPQNAYDDLDRVAAILEEHGQEDMLALGFDDAALDALFGEAGESITVQEIETGQLSAAFWITVRGPMTDQAKALTRLKAVMKDLPEVSVELGTIIVDGDV